MDIVTTSVSEGWRVRRQRIGSRTATYYPNNLFATEEGALAWIAENKANFPKSRLGIVWIKTEVTQAPVEWIHNSI